MTGPDGNLYYLSRTAQALYKIASTNSTAPAIAQQPVSASVNFDDPITFSVSATGTAPLQYQWQKNEVNIAGANESSYTITNTQLTDAGDYRVIITNITGQIISDVATLTIIPNERPTAMIVTPAENTMYAAGTSISFSGTGTDREDGALSAERLSWQINFHHDDHNHDEPVRSGISAGTFDIPDQGETSANVWYRIILSVTDSKGSVGKDSVDILPKKSILNFATVPSGLQVTVDGQPRTTPVSIESVEGLKREIGVATDQSLNENSYVFAKWLHGGEPIQVIATPTDDVTYTAMFDIVLAANEMITELFPNPAKDWIYLKQKEIKKVMITDMVGRVHELPIETQQDITLIDVRLLQSGLYLLQFSSQGISFRAKIVIQP